MVCALNPLVHSRDPVIINDENVYLSTDPQTIHEDTTVYFNLTSKKYTGNIDVALGINSSNFYKPKNPQLKIGNGSYNPLLKEVSVFNISFRSMTTWFVLRQIPVIQNINYSLKLDLDIKFNTSGKYFFGIKRSIDPISEGYYIDPYWNSSYGRYSIIQINASFIDSNLYDFPLPIFLNQTIRGFQQADADDTRFLNPDNTTEYKYHAEFINSTTGIFWVKIPFISSSVNTKFLMYYNSSTAVNNEDIENTYNSGYEMVQHLNETSGTHYDGTSNNNDGSPSVTTQGSAVGVIDGSDEFDGINDYVDTPDVFDAYNDFFVEAWFNADTIDATSRHIYADGYSLDGSPFIRFHVVEKDIAEGRGLIKRFGLFLRDNDGEGNDIDELYSSTELSEGTWYYVVAFHNGTDYGLYLNGETETFDYVQNEDVGTITRDVGSIGSLKRAGHSNYFDGIIDEVRISNIERNASWVKASFNSQNNTYSFYLWSNIYVYVPPPVTDATLTIIEPVNNSIDVCPCCIDFGFTVSHPDGNNISVQFETNYTGSWVNIDNGYYPLVTNGTYYFTVCTFNKYNTVYYIRAETTDETPDVNLSNWIKITTTTDTNCTSENITGLTQTQADDLYISAPFSLTPPTIVILLFSFLFYLGNKHEDTLLTLISSVLLGVLAIFYISEFTAISVIVAVGLLGVAVYGCFLAYVFSVNARKLQQED